MKPEEQRIAIAGACGWFIHDPACPTGVTMWKHANHPYGWREASNLPDYLNDLDAMHEAVMGLSPTLRTANASTLVEICGSCAAAINATAEQRAKAFLRTVGRWTVSPQ